MNFLGHVFLSGDNFPLLYGNFIADAIKGRDYEKYPLEISRGIQLHRQIDTFTDEYKLFQPFKQNLYPLAGKLTPVVLDIYLDHLLAKNWEHFHPVSLETYSNWVYKILHNYKPHPKRIMSFLPHMEEHNWLLNYAKPEGFRWATVSVGKRFKYPRNLEEAVNFCIIEEDSFRPTFFTFINEIHEYVKITTDNFYANS